MIRGHAGNALGFPVSHTDALPRNCGKPRAACASPIWLPAEALGVRDPFRHSRRHRGICKATGPDPEPIFPPDDSRFENFWSHSLRSGQFPSRPAPQMASKGGTVSGLLASLRTGHPEERAHAAKRLWELVSQGQQNTHIKKQRQQLENVCHGIASPPVTGRLLQLLNEQRSGEEHAAALGLLEYSVSRSYSRGEDIRKMLWRILDADAVRPIVALLSSSCPQVVNMAVKLLSRLSELQSGCQEIMAHGALVPVLCLLMDPDNASSKFHAQQLVQNFTAFGQEPSEEVFLSPAKGLLVQGDLCTSGICALLLLITRRALKDTMQFPLSYFPESVRWSTWENMEAADMNSIDEAHNLQHMTASFDVLYWMQQWARKITEVEPGPGIDGEQLLGLFATAIAPKCCWMTGGEKPDGSSPPAFRSLSQTAAAMEWLDHTYDVRSLLWQLNSSSPQLTRLENRPFRLQGFLESAQGLISSLGGFADNDRAFASDMACACLLILNHICVSGGLPCSRGTLRAINRALVPQAVCLLRSVDSTDRALAAQVLSSCISRDPEAAQAAVRSQAVQVLVMNLALSAGGGVDRRGQFLSFASALKAIQLLLKDLLSLVSGNRWANSEGTAQGPICLPGFNAKKPACGCFVARPQSVETN
mmetsp:Transcript_17533/g.42079  ORF Transcript_17533/g.42079 Transcript_17533/m.42079 type:complete len:647 (+) Transcript_17533:463-2403(+)